MAVDLLKLELDLLPPTTLRTSRLVQRGLSRALQLDWTLGLLSRLTLGRPGMRAVEGYMAATNRLLLVAPEAVLEPVGALNDLLNKRRRDQEPESREQWATARSQLTAISRSHLGMG